MSKHTPGPDSSGHYENCDFYGVDNPNDAGEFCDCIALRNAAPDLLEAAEAAEALLDFLLPEGAILTDDGAVAKLRAAIAKARAEGGAS